MDMFDPSNRTNIGGVPGLTQEMVDNLDQNPDYDPREADDLRGDDDDDRSADSEQADAMAKLGELEDDDPKMDVIGDIMEITHDGKVTKELLKAGVGNRLKMGYKTYIRYKAYFYKDHIIFDQSEPDGPPVELCLGDNSWPDGLQTGVEKMRRGEVAKIRIKKIHGFGRPLRVDELKFPKGYEVEGSEKRGRLTGETIIYEVELVDFVERKDVEGDGNLYKYYIKEAEKNEWETANDQDEIIVDLKVTQDEQGEGPVYLEKKAWSTDLADPELTVTLQKVVQSLKRGEESKVEVKASFLNENDEALKERLVKAPVGEGQEFNPEEKFFIFAKMIRLVKVEDWFKDGSTIVHSLRKGKGRSPFIDSTVSFRLSIEVEGNLVLSNYPDLEPAEFGDLINETRSKAIEEEKEQEETKTPTELYAGNLCYDYPESENLRLIPEKKRVEYLEKIKKDLYTVKLDSYELPSLLVKIIKTMKKNGVVEIRTRRMDKLRTNFENTEIGLNQYEIFPEKPKATSPQEELLTDPTDVVIRLTLLDSNHPIYFYKMLVKDKLAHVLRLKATAGKFFKSKLDNNFKKAADIYQKINGYFNFGDSTNNYAKEDETDPEFIKNNDELQAIKLTSFNNLVVCKHKMGEWQSIVGITDQIFAMSPDNIKALYFRAHAQLKLQDYDDAVECATKLTTIDPKHADGRTLLAQAKKARQAYRERETSKFAKMF